MPVYAVLWPQDTDSWNQILISWRGKHSRSSRTSEFAHIQSCRSECSSQSLSPGLWLSWSGWRPASPGECMAQTWLPDEWGHPAEERRNDNWCDTQVMTNKTHSLWFMSTFWLLWMMQCWKWCTKVQWMLPLSNRYYKADMTFANGVIVQSCQSSQSLACITFKWLKMSSCSLGQT